MWDETYSFIARTVWICALASCATAKGETAVPNSVLDAIKLGIWDFEPEETENVEYDATKALPGTNEKLSVLARRIQEGLPLWHPQDRLAYNDSDNT